MRLPTAAEELAGVELGDKRLNRRAVLVAEAAAEAPSVSFPDMVETDGELEGLYRFFANDAVASDALLFPHAEATIARGSAVELVRVAHDTTAFRFEGDRDGLGELGDHGQGFYAHFSLAIGPGEARAPLGVLRSATFIRTAETRRATRRERTQRQRTTPREEKESSRWEASVAAVEKLANGRLQLIHVMDQEADQFAAIAKLQHMSARFVIRGDQQRRLQPLQPEQVRDVLERSETRFFRTVSLARRTKPTKSHAPRDEREAQLSVRAAPVTIVRPKHAQSDAVAVQVNVVQVVELDPPPGEEAVEWTLFTSEPIETPEQVAAIVDHYRARWRIEEFFKALKTGCRFESRQLTDFEGLVRALQIFSIVAWRLLALRALSRLEKAPPASVLMSRDDMAVLRFLATKRKHVLPNSPTVRDVVLAIAAVGGHLKRNGEPGWMTLGRGYDKFLAAREGWLAARAAKM